MEDLDQALELLLDARLIKYSSSNQLSEMELEQEEIHYAITSSGEAALEAAYRFLINLM